MIVVMMILVTIIILQMIALTKNHLTLQVLERKEVELRNEVATITRCFKDFTKFQRFHQVFQRFHKVSKISPGVSKITQKISKKFFPEHRQEILIVVGWIMDGVV